ncbi:MAG: NUDIX hydrolase [Armatimonadetes bacterium]|nr:NUDIX hydrolase [Armatimonadota bacterium]
MGNPWRTLDSRVAYENPWIRVREDRVIRPDGSPGLYGVLELKPSVFIVALTEEGEAVLVRLYRYTTGTHSWEIPAGGSEGQDLLEAAQRELREEAGLLAGEWTEIGDFEGLNGVADARCHVFLARGLSPSEEDGHAEEGITDVKRASPEEIHRMILSGEIKDGETLSALMIARTWLEENPLRP